MQKIKKSPGGLAANRANRQKELKVNKKCKIVKWKNDIPIVYGEPIYNKRGDKFFQFFCVECNRWHCHGKPGPGNRHRVAHCIKNPSSAYHKTGYFLYYESEKEGKI